MHAVSFNAVHLMWQSEISIGLNCGAFNASQRASAMGFVLLGREKGFLFFSLVHVVSTAVPEINPKIMVLSY